MCFPIHAIFIQATSKYLSMIIMIILIVWLLCSGTILSASYKSLNEKENASFGGGGHLILRRKLTF